MDLSTLSKNDFSIIDYMYRNGLINKTCSSTLQKISNGIKARREELKEDQTGVSIPKMRVAMKLFISIGLVYEGARDVRSKTYYLSEKGIEVAKTIRKDVEESLRMINNTRKGK